MKRNKFTFELMNRETIKIKGSLTRSSSLDLPKYYCHRFSLLRIPAVVSFHTQLDRKMQDRGTVSVVPKCTSAHAVVRTAETIHFAANISRLICCIELK